MDETLQQFVNGIATRIENQSKWTERLLTNDSVTLRKRNRDLSDNDRLSAFSSVTGNWMTDIDLQNIYSTNIVKPTIRVNAAAMQNANVRIDIEPRFTKDSKSQMAADVAMGIAEQWERCEWTDMLEEYASQEKQLGPGVFYRTFHNPNLKRKHALSQWEEVEVEMPGVAICGECGMETSVSGELEEITACANCGSPAMVEQMPQNVPVPVPTGFSEFTTGKTQTVAIPFFEIRIDDENTQGGNLDRAKWFEHHYLVSMDELILEYPEFAAEIRGAQETQWSYALRWQQALKRNRMIPLNSNDEVVEQREVRDIHLTPAMYLNHPFSETFELKDKDEKVRFSVPSGKTLADAVFEGDKMDDPPIWCIRLVGNHVMDIFPADFIEEYAYDTFTKNSSSFWGNFLYELVALQDIVNYMLTLQVYHIKRNSITSIVYNRSSFDPEEFEEDLIPTKESLPYSVPINTQFDIIPALKMSGEPMAMFATMVEMLDKVSLASSALRGEAQPNEPYHAQLLQKQSSLGLLAPAGISKANAKVKMAKQALRCAKKYWTEEDTEEMLKLNAEWTEEFIQAFLDCDLENDLIVTYVQGSEIPTTLIEREVKLQKMMADLMNLSSLAPGMIKPEMITEVFAELTQASGIDIDINNTESDLRLAESRYDKIIEAVRQAPVQTPDPQINTIIAQQILMMPDLQPTVWEGHQTQAEFYADKQRNESAKDAPNYLLITVLNGMLQMLLQSQVMFAQMQTGAQVAAQAPAMAAEEQAQMAGEQRQAEADAQRMQLEAGDREREEAGKETDRDFQREMKVADMMNAEADRAHKERLNAKAG